MVYYQRRKIKVDYPVGNNWVFLAAMLASIAASLHTVFLLARLYKPILLVLAILYGYVVIENSQSSCENIRNPKSRIV